jgi:hypothetical protein
MVGSHRLYLLQKDEDDIKYERFFLFNTFYPGEDWQNLRATILPNTNILDWISSVNNFDPLLPGRYVQWMESISRADPSSQKKMADLMDAGVIEKIDPRENLGVSYEINSESSRLRWVPTALCVSSPDKALELVTSGDVDFEQEVVIENNGPIEIRCPQTMENTWAANGSMKVENALSKLRIIDESNPNRVSIQVDASQSGWIVLSDTWYPGWIAKVDGKPTPIYRANYLFRAVRLEKGSQRVDYYYQPGSFRWGVFITLLTLALLFVLWSRSKRSGLEW